MTNYPFIRFISATIQGTTLLIILSLAACSPVEVPTATAVSERPTLTLTATDIVAEIPTSAAAETATLPATATAAPTAIATPSNTATPSPTTTPTVTPSPAATPTAQITQEVTFDLVYHSGGFLEAIDAEEDLLYLGVGRRLRIMDVTNLEQPAVLGHSPILGDFVQDVTVQENVAYLAGGAAGLLVFDVTNPAEPRQLETSGVLPHYVNRIQVQQNILYALGRASLEGYFLWLLNIEVPGQPELIAALPLAEAGADIQVAGDYAYIPCRPSTANLCMGQVYVVSVNNPAEPELVGEIAPGGSYSTVTVQDNKAYILNENQRADLLAYDLTNPLAPLLVNRQADIESFGLVKELVVAGDYVFNTTFFGEFDLCSTAVTIVSLIPEESPAPAEPFILDRCGGQMAVSGERVYVLHDSNITAFGVSADGVQLLATWSTNDIDTTLSSLVITEDGYGFATFSNKNTITPLDLRNPALPALTGWPFLIDWPEQHPYEIATRNGYLYTRTTVGNDYFYVLDVSDLNDNQVTGQLTFEVSEGRYDITLHSHYSYLTGASPNILVVDVQNPAEPVAIGEVPIGNCCLESTTVDGEFLYVAGSYASDSGKRGGFFQVLDVTEPAAPQLRSTIELTETVHVVEVADEVAYVGSTRCRNENCTTTLRLYDVSDPANPVELGRVAFPGEAFGLAIAGDYVLIAADSAGVYAVNVNDPGQPYLAGHVTLPGLSQRIVMVEGLAYVVAPGGGLYVLQLLDS